MEDLIHPYDGINRAHDKVKGLGEIITALIDSPNSIDMALHALYYMVGSIEGDLEASVKMMEGTYPAKPDVPVKRVA